MSRAPSDLPLSGRVALVTGASRGIGQAAAHALALRGARVLLVSRRMENLQPVAEELERQFPGRARACPFHLGQLEAIPDFIAALTREEGCPSILVNNAATNPYFGPMVDLPWSAWEKTFAVNLKAPFALCRALARELIAREMSASMIQISSIYGLQGAALQGCYGMTKAALISMTQTLASEWGQHGIRVNAVAPGLIETRFSKVLVESEDFMSGYRSQSALGRAGQPPEVGGLIAWLATEEASYVTGQTFRVDGGHGLGGGTPLS